MGAMKTPGVYVVEKNAFPSSVVEVATAVPAFIGYTEKAVNGGKSLINVPMRITSLSEFVQYFGEAPAPGFELKPVGAGATAKPAPASKKNKDDSAEKGDKGEKATPPPPAATVKANYMLGDKPYMLNQTEGRYLLYYSMRLFFQNGGGPCYIVSVGTYGDDIDASKITGAFDELVKEQEPTMIVIPDAISLKEQDCVSVQQATLMHCGSVMKNRFAILDVYDGYKERNDPSGDCIENFRNAIGTNFLNFGAAYYPWVNTSIVQDNELSFDNFIDKEELKNILLDELITPYKGKGGNEIKLAQMEAEINNITNANLSDVEKELLNKVLITISPKFNALLTEIKEKLNLLPPSAAMAGIYTMVDNNRGVWKAPANVSMNSVVAPTVNITHENQEDLNVPVQGKAVNAIRPFIGEGVLVWGARTLDGNSLDWRYINVRRTMIMLEESIRLASKAYVFENNDANTWVTMKGMISNFLNGIWKRGGLAGASPEDAFSVHVGLGETMTSVDILEGVLRITVLVALIRPAEFIEITFQQQMQKS